MKSIAIVVSSLFELSIQATASCTYVTGLRKLGPALFRPPSRADPIEFASAALAERSRHPFSLPRCLESAHTQGVQPQQHGLVLGSQPGGCSSDCCTLAAHHGHTRHVLRYVTMARKRPRPSRFTNPTCVRTPPLLATAVPHSAISQPPRACMPAANELSSVKRVSSLACSLDRYACVQPELPTSMWLQASVLQHRPAPLHGSALRRTETSIWA